jgi:hypothetical protein
MMSDKGNILNLSGILASQVKSIKRELKEWEHQFVDQNGYKPSKQDISAFPDISRD